MRIALDARTIYRDERRGTGRNLIDLYHHVARLRPKWRITAFHRTPGPLPALLPEPQVRPSMVEMVGDRIDAWCRWRLPLAAWQEHADLLHCPANHCPTWMTVPTLVTIHDLIPLDLPRGRNTLEVNRFEQSVAGACRRAAGIICPSRHIAERLVDEHDADPARVSVVPWAPDTSMHAVDADTAAATAGRYGLDRPYILHFGAAAPRKNTARLLHAWNEIPPRARDGYQLLVVGLDEAFAARMRHWVAQLDIADSVRLHGFAPAEDLPALLSGAEVLAYPSLAEGFGLPILDAWITNTAVLTGQNSSLPEVAEDAAQFVNAADVRSIADGLEHLLTRDLVRKQLAIRGHQRVGKFTWENTARLFVEALERAAGELDHTGAPPFIETTCRLEKRISM